jgi:transposase
MNKKATYFPRTTAQQRRLLFEVWEETGDRDEACQRAPVRMGTFYKWKPRFEAAGYAGLEVAQSRAPKAPYQTPPALEAQVVEMRREHPSWGKRRIADELAKDNHWVPLVSPNTVKRILQDAGLWAQAENAARKGELPAAYGRRKSLDRR